jgi:RimJ/RimL family protein N-acetyltransferase
MSAHAIHAVCPANLTTATARSPAPTLRRACADDAAAFGHFLQGLSAGSRRLRFHGHCNPQSKTLAQQMCAVDGVHHQAWLAWVGSGDTAVVIGEARFVRRTDNGASAGDAELAIVVADDWQGRGVADALMQQLLTAAHAAGLRQLHGDVLNGNVRMEAFMQRYGFEADLMACGEVLRMSRAVSTLGRAPGTSAGALAAGARRGWVRQARSAAAGLLTAWLGLPAPDRQLVSAPR